MSKLTEKVGKSRAKRSWEASRRTVVFELEVLDKLEPHAKKRGITVNELVRQLVNKAIFEGWL